MNLILLFEDDCIDNNKVRLTGRRTEHIIKVHRAGVEAELKVGLINGLMGTGRIVSIAGAGLEMEVRLTERPPEPLPVTLILALPRPKVLRRVLQSVTAMGVKKIYLINAYRVEKSYWQTPFLAEEVIRQQLILGLEQGCDTVMPEVFLRPLFRPFAEDELTGIFEGTTPLVADPYAEETCHRHLSERITLAVGPEGGFIAYELQRLTELGFKPVSLGKRTLKVETAVPALLSCFM